jgi:adenosylmethionine-8-amino-7-oxononanoate aminotransferase
LLVLGKGVNGGYAPLSVLLTRTDLVDVIAKNSLNYMHAQTYVNTPSSLAAGVAVVDFMDRYRVIEKSRTVGAYFLSELKKLESYEGVGHAGGRGMFGGLELVENKASKTPLSRSLKASESLMEILFSKGLVAWNNSGQIDGEKGDLLVLGPPLITTLEQIDEMIEVLKSGLEDWIVKMKKLGVRFS